MSNTFSLALATTISILFSGCASSASATVVGDQKAVATLDTQYQLAVKNSDSVTMARILADDFILVTGNGKHFGKTELLDETHGKVVYEHQEDSEQVVRVWGDTAVVTALLWSKGTDSGKAFEHKLWFSDFYVRTPLGWRYVFGQASLPLPRSP
ncbi:MAG: nuclear transport factor 2 family protein [Dokdonella sp.]